MYVQRFVYRYIQGPYTQTCGSAVIWANISRYWLYLGTFVILSVLRFLAQNNNIHAWNTRDKLSSVYRYIEGFVRLHSNPCTCNHLFTVTLKASYFCIQIHVRATIWVNIYVQQFG